MAEMTQHQRELLLEVQAMAQRDAIRGATRDSSSTEPRTRECQRCGASFVIDISAAGDSVFGKYAARVMLNRWHCDICRDVIAEEREQEEREASRAQVLARIQRVRGTLTVPGIANFPPKLRDAAFATLHEDFERKAATATVLEWAAGFPRLAAGYSSLVLYSPGPGTGKTTLAICAANAILEAHDGLPSVRYETGPSLGVRLRSTYNRTGWEKDEDGNAPEREADIYRQMAGVRLLILDDIADPDKEKASEATRRMYFNVIDERYQANMPIIAISNAGPQTMRNVIGEYAYDRLMEMAGGSVTEVAGKSRAERLKVRS